MEKIECSLEVINNAKVIYEKYEKTISEIVGNTKDLTDLLLDAMGTPFQDEEGKNLSYAENFLYCYMVLKKIKEIFPDENIHDYLNEDPFFYIINYQAKGALVAYLTYYKKEFGLLPEYELEFISNINNKKYMKKLNENIKELVANSTGFQYVEGSTGISLNDILVKEMTPEEKYLLVINSIISTEISIVNQPEEYADIFETLTIFFNTLYNHNIKNDEIFFRYYIMFLSESVESIPLIYELSKDYPELWELTVEIIEEPKNKEE